MRKRRLRLDRPQGHVGTDAMDVGINHPMRQMYRKTLAYWALDILSQSSQSTKVQWQEPDPMDDDPYCHHWKTLYNGSILDD